MSDEGSSGVALQGIEQGPLEAMYWLECRVKAKWAIKIAGRDENGAERRLGLDWDGVWHPLDPITGLPTRVGKIVRFRDLQPGEVAIDMHSEAQWPYAACIDADRWTWTAHGLTPRLSHADVWSGEDDLVRIFAVNATASNLQEIIDAHHKSVTEGKR